MSTNLVTIVVPVYNAEQFLHKNIESIINQTYRDLEIIYVCDGCSDHTVAILQEYVRKDSRIIVWVESDNQGAAVARNIGMNMARGDWIIFLDADDLFELCMIESMLEMAIKEQADMVCCYWEYFDDVPSERAYIDNGLRKLYCKRYPVVKVREELYHIMQIVDNSPCTKLVHRSVFARNEVFFQNIPNANDAYFSMITAINSHKIAYIDKVFLHYRSNKGRYTLSTNRDLKKNYIWEACDKIFKYIDHTDNRIQLLKSFYNYVLFNLSVYVGSPVYDELCDMLRNIYLKKWRMQGSEIVRNLSYINRVLYKNIFNNSSECNVSDLNMRAKVEFVSALAKKGCSLWGVGTMGKRLLEELSRSGVQIQHVFDSAQDKWGQVVYGYKVECFNEVQADHIIVTSLKFYDEIVNLLRDCVKNIYNLEQQIWLIPCGD